MLVDLVKYMLLISGLTGAFLGFGFWIGASA